MNSASSSYDAMPYPSKFFLQTHPDRLAAAATLYGMKPAAIENCRVLELGCGNGSNLISHAYGLPSAAFVGIDLARSHIETAKASAEELGLRNIEFRQMDVMELSAAEIGKFDYITAHGLFSWVPDAVRKRVLEVFRGMLERSGVGYVSYNAYPGAYVRELGRSIMRMHTDEAAEPAKKVEKAISFLAFITENVADQGIYKQILESELKRHFEHGAEDIFHDDLADIYRPYYFREFSGMLERAGLQFLSEAELHAASRQGIGAEAARYIDSLESITEQEQHLDLLRGRTFRQTLFCHEEVELDREPAPEILDKFYLSSAIRPASLKPQLVLKTVEKFSKPAGFTIDIDHPLTKAALYHLGEIWGSSVKTSELLDRAVEMLEERGADKENWDEQKKITRTILLQLGTQTDLIELHVSPSADPIERPELPRTNRLSLWQLRDASNILTRLNKDLQVNDAVSKRLLELMDGTRERADLLYELKVFIGNNDEIGSKEELLDGLETWLDESLAELGRLGVFEA